MEQIFQLGALPSEAAPVAGAAAQTPGDDSLRDELAKWRERVPKLAAALRQRAEEAESLKQELERQRRMAGAGTSGAAGIRARDELIAELEGKLDRLAERHKAAQGELHKRELEVDELKSDLAAWKGKWQSLTRALDEQAAAVDHENDRTRDLEEANESLRRQLAEHTGSQQGIRAELEEAVEERDSLRRRNEQLFETTELANRQIGSLTDSLAELRANLKRHREQEAQACAERDALRAELETVRASLAEAEMSVRGQADALQAATAAAQTGAMRVAELEERLRAAMAAGARSEQAVAELTAEVHLVSLAAASGVHAAAEADARTAEAARVKQDAEGRLADAERARSELQMRLDEQAREVARLTEVVGVAQRTTAERESERRELSERLQALEARNEHLEEQLGERSALVVTLEQDRTEAARERAALQQEREELEEALMRAERHAKENAEHVTQLDAKLERQKELMESLEQELAEAREEQVRAAKARQAESAGAESEVGRLQDQVRKLEGLVRERTEALNRLEWRRQMAGTDAGEPVEAGTAEAPDAGDEKLILVLNQQLTDARARNAELLARIRNLEAAAASGGTGERIQGDDLTRIHGVGQKLAEQLNDLGIHHYQQIAELDEAALADESHVLHGHRGRILRDGWIDQAVKLISH